MLRFVRIDLIAQIARVFAVHNMIQLSYPGSEMIDPITSTVDVTKPFNITHTKNKHIGIINLKVE